MTELYRPLYLNETPIVFTSRRTSELIKYAANAFLALKITYINEIADLCEALGADVQQVAKGTGADVLVIITEWDQFRALDLDRIKLLMKTPTLVDLRNIYKPEDLRSRGFKYASIGRA